MLTVYDVPSMTVSQRFSVLPWPPEEPYSSFYEGEDFVALFLYGSQVAVISEDDSGHFTLALTAELDAAHAPEFFDSINASMDFDGRRLIIADGFYEKTIGQEQECAFTLTVYDETGLAFSGEYTSSLDVGEIMFNRICRTMNRDGLVVSWEES